MITRSIFVLGLIHGHIPAIVEHDGARFRENSGLAIAIPADAVLDLINSEQTAAHRQAGFERIVENPTKFFSVDQLNTSLRAAVYLEV
jgi:hypothetical protein